MRRPWFSFYAADWLADGVVMAMTPAERGVYIQLLAIQWREGSIPAHKGTLYRLAGLQYPDDEMEILDSVLCKFESLPGSPDRLVNGRLERERQEAEAISAANSLNGRRGGRPNKINDRKATAFDSLSIRLSETKANGKPNESLSQSQSQSQTQEEEKHTPDKPAGECFDFESVYDAYPRKEGRKKGLQRCRSQITTRLKYDALVKAVKNYAEKVAIEGTETRFVKQFDTFVNCWEDWVEYQPPLLTERKYANVSAPRPAVAVTRKVDI